MSATIHIHPAVYKSVRDYIDYMQQEIAKAMTIPEWALRRSDIRNAEWRRRYQATEVMRAELLRLYMLLPPSPMVVPKGLLMVGDNDD